MNGEDITADVSITTHGVPDNDFVSLAIGGRPSMPFLISELTEAKVQLLFSLLHFLRSKTAPTSMGTLSKQTLWGMSSNK